MEENIHQMIDDINFKWENNWMNIKSTGKCMDYNLMGITR